MARKATYPIADIFINRWSSRAFSDEPVSKEQLMSLFEAARWAPSAYNEQPWRFVYANKGAELVNELVAVMEPVNQVWAKNAAVLVVVISKNNFTRTGAASTWHSFDAGAACMSLALQGSMNGLAVHVIGGFDNEKIRSMLHISAEFSVEIMIAIGHPGNKEKLSPELQARETPNDRKQLNEIVFEDVFNG